MQLRMVHVKGRRTIRAWQFRRTKAVSKARASLAGTMVTERNREES